MTLSEALKDAIVDATTSIKTVAELHALLVEEITSAVLLRLSTDLGLSYADMVERYKDDIVARFVGTGAGVDDKCKGRTTRGTRCVRDALHEGFCKQHLPGAMAEIEQRRKLEAYAAKIEKRKAERSAACDRRTPLKTTAV